MPDSMGYPGLLVFGVSVPAILDDVVAGCDFPAVYFAVLCNIMYFVVNCSSTFFVCILADNAFKQA